MANVTSMQDRDGAILSITDTNSPLDVNDNMAYTLINLGVATGGAASTSAVIAKYTSDDVAAENTVTEGDDKQILLPGLAVVIPGGVKKIALKAVASGSALISVIPMPGV